MTAPELAVVIPAWNERENVAVLLPLLRDVLEDLGVSAELVIADGGRADMAPLRRLLSHVLNRAYARVLALPLRDLSSGFRMYRREVLDGLWPAARDFDVLEELLVRAHAEGWRVVEVPFHYMTRGSG